MPKKSNKASFYDQVVSVSETYLGPAAGRFIDRQIQNHLDKTPASLQPADMPQLIDWIRIAVSFLTEDSSIVEEYILELRNLAEPTTKKGR